MSPAKKKLLTLSEVSKRTGISMPTLQKYKKQHADQIPSEGEGRKQRYYVESLDVFRRLKEEGLKRRGRKAGSSQGKKKKAKTSKKRSSTKKKTSRKKSKSSKSKGGESDLLSLQQIMRETGISYPTLLRYVKLYLDQIPHVGSGRTRRYKPEAVEVFRELRANSKRGRKPKSASAAKRGSSRAASSGDRDLSKRIAQLERAHTSLEKQLADLVKVLRAPMTVTVRRS